MALGKFVGHVRQLNTAGPDKMVTPDFMTTLPIYGWRLDDLDLSTLGEHRSVLLTAQGFVFLLREDGRYESSLVCVTIEKMGMSCCHQLTWHGEQELAVRVEGLLAQVS